MKGRPFFHDGMREYQDRFDGRRVAEIIEERRKHYEFTDEDRELISSSPFVFIATAYGEHVDGSIKSGDPGFIKIVGPGTLEIPEYDGNSMYRTIGNIARNPNVGLLFVRFDGTSRRIRVSGRATILDDAPTLARHVGAKLVVRVDCEIFPNCPRYVPDLVHGTPSPFNPREGEGTPPPPEWKSRDYIRDILPEHDPHRGKI
jgi:predicted pyridoxine 5'-phosphate oxidase superfamily flavin-nucleotide-binding protein